MTKRPLYIMGREIGTFDGDVHQTPDGVLMFPSYVAKNAEVDSSDLMYGFCPNTGIAFLVDEDGGIVDAYDFMDAEMTTDSITDACIEADDYARILVST